LLNTRKAIMETPYAAWRLSHESPRRVAAALICLLSIACGDAEHRLGSGPESDSNGLGATSMVPCSQGTPLDPIDLMEDGDGTIDFTAGRAGVWFVFNDRTGTQEPSLFAEAFAMSKLDPPRDSSRHAAHTVGSGFVEWGAGIGMYLRAQQAYDASKTTGLSFWARRSKSSTGKLQLAVPDGATSPLGGQCDDAAGLCHDDFGRDLELTEEFQYFNYPWQDMVARNWSEMDVPGINPAKIYGVLFQVGRDEAFDFWIDDLSFTCR